MRACAEASSLSAASNKPVSIRNWACHSHGVKFIGGFGRVRPLQPPCSRLLPEEGSETGRAVRRDLGAERIRYGLVVRYDLNQGVEGAPIPGVSHTHQCGFHIGGAGDSEVGCQENPRTVRRALPGTFLAQRDSGQPRRRTDYRRSGVTRPPCWRPPPRTALRRQRRPLALREWRSACPVDRSALSAHTQVRRSAGLRKVQSARACLDHARAPKVRTTEALS